MSSYETAIARMYALGHELAQTPSHKFDLAHMRILLGALENPERRFPGVLIAGTNGKGSTAATLASILRASGWACEPGFIRLRTWRESTNAFRSAGSKSATTISPCCTMWWTVRQNAWSVRASCPGIPAFLKC